MTTRREAETVLFDVIHMDNEPIIFKAENENAETSTTVDKPYRRRVNATYCPLCSSWVEVRLQPVRLHCTGCGQEARP